MKKVNRHIAAQNTLWDDTKLKKSGAQFSINKKYRYSLWRIWDEKKPKVMFIGLNPSTANETTDDPTIRRVVQISKNLGYGGVYMMNCWAYIATDPTLLQINHISEEWNNELLTITASKCSAVVFAWGNFKIVRDLGRDKELLQMFPYAYALYINKNGSPKHPLYCKSDSKLVLYGDDLPF